MGNVTLTAKSISDPTKVLDVLIDSGVFVMFNAPQVDARAGDLYFCTSLFTGVAAAGTATVGITTTTRTPISIEALATASAVLRIYEGSTFTGGTAGNCHPYNLTTAGTPTATLVDTPTISVPGNVIATLLLPGGSGGNSSGGRAGVDFSNGYLILDGPAQYIFEVTNVSASAETINLAISVGT